MFSMQQSIRSLAPPPPEESLLEHVCVESVDSVVVNFPCCFLALPLRKANIIERIKKQIMLYLEKENK